MKIGRIIRGIPEEITIACRNLHSAALGDGEVVSMLLSSDTPPTGYTRIPGVDVKQSAAAGEANAVGITKIAAGTVAQGDYVMVQIYGYHSNVKTTAAALAVGTVFSADAAGAIVAAQVAALTDIPDKRLGISITVGASNRAACWIAAMGH